MRKSVLLAGLAIALTAPFARAVVIGYFPGLDQLVDKADAIVILRIDGSRGDFDSPTLYSTHDCYIYQTLKGDIPARTRITLQLMDTRSSFVNPFAHSSSHLMFLTKKRSQKEPTEYRTIEYQGANVRVLSFGLEKIPPGETIKEQIVSLLQATAEYERKQHEEQQAFLNRLIADKPGSARSGTR